MKKFIAAELDKTLGVLGAIREDAELHDQIQLVVEKIVSSLRADGKLLVAGNGGSAADAQHLAGEFVSRFNYDRPGLPAIALTTDTSILTAIGNDYGYERLFERQVQALGRKGDVFLGISTSGNSPNVLAALRQARAMGIYTIGMTGQSGGAMNEFCNVCLRMPSPETPKVQEGHITVGHIICGLVEATIFPQKADEC